MTPKQLIHHILAPANNERFDRMVDRISDELLDGENQALAALEVAKLITSGFIFYNHHVAGFELMDKSGVTVIDYPSDNDQPLDWL